MLQFMGSQRVRYILGTEQQQAIVNATKNLILHLTGSSPGLSPWAEETMVVPEYFGGTSSCAQRFTGTVTSTSPRESTCDHRPPDGEGDGSLGRRDPMADSWLPQDWNLVCLAQGPRAWLGNG